ncbi:hypothetical protein CROQUDRAFT_700429 [Cronartium quercuum f. sp. fusiforme G11]|uniref:Uncharacterized protein n=1 Tax=Cronartium quercuum f. sp. fusiforme G11 TaxID=708437 RepID=A0A9P6TDR2_9BASI|nr:hypothetical protein CROQUDRAFT_700429 [Cronartium quercuum f. sp. fusiforme G11]
MIFIAKVRRSLLLVGCTIWLHSTSAMHTNELKPVEDLTAKTGALLGDPLCQPSSTIEASMEKISSKASTERTSNYEQSEKKKAASGKGILNPNSECFWPPTYPKHFTEAYRSLPPNPPPQLRISFTEWHPVFDNEEDATRWYSYIRFYNLPSHAGFTLESIGHRTPSQEFWNHVARQNLNLGAPKMAPPPEPTGWLGVFHGIEDYQNWVAVGQHYVYSEQVEYSPFLVTPLVAPQKTNTQLGIRLEASDHRHSVGFVPLVIWSTIPRGSPNNPARPAEELILPENGPLYKTSRLEESRIKEERIQKWSQTQRSDCQEILSKVSQETERYYRKFWNVNPAPSYPPTTKDSRNSIFLPVKPPANNVGPNYIHFRPQIHPAYPAQPMKPTFENYGQIAKEQYSSVHFQTPNVQGSQSQNSVLKEAYSLERLSRNLPQITATARNVPQDIWEKQLASTKDLELAHDLVSKAMNLIENFRNQVCKLKDKDLGHEESGEFNPVPSNDEKMRPRKTMSSPMPPMEQSSGIVASDLSQTSTTLARKPATSHLSSSQRILEKTKTPNTLNSDPTYLESGSEIPVSGEVNQPEINAKESSRYAPKSSHICPNFLSPTHGIVETCTELLIFGCEFRSVKLRETESKDATQAEITQEKSNMPPIIDTTTPNVDGGSLEANNSPSMLNSQPVFEKPNAEVNQWHKITKADRKYQLKNKKMDQESMVKKPTSFENPTIAEPSHILKDHGESFKAAGVAMSSNSDMGRISRKLKGNQYLSPNYFDALTVGDDGLVQSHNSPHQNTSPKKDTENQGRSLFESETGMRTSTGSPTQEIKCTALEKDLLGSHDNNEMNVLKEVILDKQIYKEEQLIDHDQDSLPRDNPPQNSLERHKKGKKKKKNKGAKAKVQNHHTSPKKDTDNQGRSLFEVETGMETSTGSPTQEIKCTALEKDLLGSHDNNEMNILKEVMLDKPIYKEEQLVDHDQDSLPRDDPPQNSLETHKKDKKKKKNKGGKAKFQRNLTPQDDAKHSSRQKEIDRQKMERKTELLGNPNSFVIITPDEFVHHILHLEDKSELLPISFDPKIIRPLEQLEESDPEFLGKMVAFVSQASEKETHEIYARWIAWNYQEVQHLMKNRWEIIRQKSSSSLKRVATMFHIREDFPVFYDAKKEDYNKMKTEWSTLKHADMKKIYQVISYEEVNSRLGTLDALVEHSDLKQIWSEEQMKEIKKQGYPLGRLLNIASMLDLSKEASEWDNVSDQQLEAKAMEIWKTMIKGVTIFDKNSDTFFIELWYDSLRRSNALEDPHLATVFDQRLRKLVSASKSVTFSFATATNKFMRDFQIDSTIKPMIVGEFLGATYVGIPWKYITNDWKEHYPNFDHYKYSVKFQRLYEMLGHQKDDLSETHQKSCTPIKFQHRSLSRVTTKKAK